VTCSSVFVLALKGGDLRSECGGLSLVSGSLKLDRVEVSDR